MVKWLLYRAWLVKEWAMASRGRAIGLAWLTFLLLLMVVVMPLKIFLFLVLVFSFVGVILGTIVAIIFVIDGDG